MKTFEQFLIEFDQKDLHRLIFAVDEAADALFSTPNGLSQVNIGDVKKLGLARHRKREKEYSGDDDIRELDDDNDVRNDGEYYMALSKYNTRPGDEFISYMKHAHGVHATALGNGAFSVALKGSSSASPKYILKFTEGKTDFKLINNIYTHKLWEKNTLWPMYLYVRKIGENVISIMEPIVKIATSDTTSPRSLSEFMRLIARVINDEGLDCEVKLHEAIERSYNSKQPADWLRSHGVTLRMLIDFVDVGSSMFYSGRPSWDLHNANFGWRANGEIVLFDPIAHTEAESLAGR